jgi:hypothetical protein
MGMVNATGAIDLGAWEIGELRFLAFPRTPLPNDTRSYWKQWEALFGAKPEATSTDGNVETGSFAHGARLTRTYRPNDGAIQWVLEKTPATEKPDAFLLSPDALISFRELVPRLLVNAPPIRRLAFGGQFFLRVEDRAHGYKVLEKYLHLGLKYSDDEGDFYYQYNRRRWSRCVPGIQINRLSRWTWVPLGEVRIVDGKLVSPRESACRLELDINTAPEFQETIPSDRTVPLFEEMIDLAVEISARGDVP